MKKVIVLMSTYNGAKYLRIQLDSIFAQQNVNVQLLVRDDGSTDSTLTILKEYATRGNLRYYTGSNLGPARSFMDLIAQVPLEKDCYYAFADQDDYWLPAKLFTAITKLNTLPISEQPCLYHGKRLRVDQALRVIPSVSSILPTHTFNHAVVFSGVGGCTFVLNENLIKLAKQYIPQSLIMHDGWLHKLCLAVGGAVYYDSEPYIYYRQHEKNVCAGINLSFKVRLKRHWDFWFGNPDIYSNMLQELVRGYKTQITPQNLAICQKVLDYKRGWKYKWALLRDKTIRSGNKQIDRRYIINVILGRF